MRYEVRVCDTCGVASREMMIGEPLSGWEVHDGDDYCSACVWDILECGDNPSTYRGSRAGQHDDFIPERAPRT